MIAAAARTSSSALGRAIRRKSAAASFVIRQNTRQQCLFHASAARFGRDALDMVDTFARRHGAFHFFVLYFTLGILRHDYVIVYDFMGIVRSASESPLKTLRLIFKFLKLTTMRIFLMFE